MGYVILAKKIVIEEMPVRTMPDIVKKSRYPEELLKVV